MRPSRIKPRRPGPGSEHVDANFRERRKIIARKWARTAGERAAGQTTPEERREFEQLLARWKGPVPQGETPEP